MRSKYYHGTLNNFAIAHWPKSPSFVNILGGTWCSPPSLPPPPPRVVSMNKGSFNRFSRKRRISENQFLENWRQPRNSNRQEKKPVSDIEETFNLRSLSTKTKCVMVVILVLRSFIKFAYFCLIGKMDFLIQKFISLILHQLVQKSNLCLCLILEWQ